MPPARFKPEIPARDRQQALTLDGSAAEIGLNTLLLSHFESSIEDKSSLKQ
jgi:hypothetical protein